MSVNDATNPATVLIEAQARQLAAQAQTIADLTAQRDQFRSALRDIQLDAFAPEESLPVPTPAQTVLRVRVLTQALATRTQERDQLQNTVELLSSRTEVKAMIQGLADLRDGRVEPLNPADLCAMCGGPYQFDTTIPSETWNRVVRAQNLPEYLCLTCIVRVFMQAKQGFTAELWGGEFNGETFSLSLGDVESRLVACQAERDREAELRREAEAHVRNLQTTLAQKPYADEFDDIEHRATKAEADLSALRPSTLKVYSAVLSLFGDPEDCDDCGDLSDGGHDRPCRVHGPATNGLVRAMTDLERTLGPCVCGCTVDEHHEDDFRPCKVCGRACRGFRLAALVPTPTKD